MKVFVYFNLHKKKWSVRDMKTQKVIAHTDKIFLKDCTFKVRAGGRARVIREKRKNVHAGVIGTIVDNAPVKGVSVTYNPYKYKTFVIASTLEPILVSEYTSMIVQDKVPVVTV